ncbi:MAG: DNA double-strand break repair nuclease NurA [Candidatus Micrarchaeota archaeon]
MIPEASIRKVVEEIRQSESRVAALTARLRKDNPAFSAPDIADSRLFQPVEDVPAEGRIAAVDGGLLSQELHALDLLIVRSAAVVFNHEAGKLKGYEFIPRAFPEPEVFVDYALEGHELAQYIELRRLQSEIRLANEVLAKSECSALFLDGSIIPQHADKPPANSPLHPLYSSLIESYLRLYSAAEKRNCKLVGVIKDSKGKHFLSLLLRHAALASDSSILQKTNDTALIFSLLQEQERTFAFRYASASDSPALRDLKGYEDKVWSCYIKAVKYDRPLRIDFLLPRKDSKSIDEICSLVYSLSRHNKQYAYPPILIEADLRAALEQKEMDVLYQHITAALGLRPSIFRLRRNSRPFR